ncbi:MAG: sulfatase [Phycisphaerae bacterium]
MNDAQASTQAEAPSSAGRTSCFGLTDAVAICVTATLAHAWAQSTLAAWSGVRIGILDAPLTAIVIGPLLFAALTLWAVVSGLSARLFGAQTGAEAKLQARRRILFGLFAIYLSVAALFWLRRRGLTGLSVAAIGWLIVFDAVLWRLLRRRAGSFVNVVIGVTAAVFMAVGATTLACFATDIPGTARRLSFAAGLLVVPIGGAWIVFARSGARAFGGALKSVCAYAAVAAVGTAVATLAPRPHNGWHCTTDGGQNAAADDAPNVVLIVLDTVAATHMELFGFEEPTMPNLTRYAHAECDVVLAAASPATWTGASHASMFTGMWPSVHGCRMPRVDEPDLGGLRFFPMRDDIATMAEWFNDHGYHTAGIASNYANLWGMGVERGFQDYDARPSDAYSAWDSSWAFFGEGRLRPGEWLRDWLPPAIRQYCVAFDRRRTTYRRAGAITDAAMRWTEAHGDQPYLLFLNYLDAHDDYMPLSGMDQPAAERPGWGRIPQKMYERYLAGEAQFPTGLVEELSALYDLELRDLDVELARLLEHLRQRPDYDRTIVIITSDHGEEFLEHGFLRHGWNVYEPQMRVPLLVRLPPSLKHHLPNPVPSHFQPLDLFATLAALIEKDDMPQTQGSPWGAGRDYAMTEMFIFLPDVPRTNREQHAIMLGSMKYIRSSDGTEEVYDLAADPQERRNLIDENGELAQRGRELLDRRDRLFESVKHLKGRRGQLQLKKLEALGYVKD